MMIDITDKSAPLLTWKEWVEVAPDGTHEADGFRAIDIGFGNALVAMFKGALVSGQGKAYEPFKQFLARSPSDQLKQSPQQDPKGFLRALRASLAGRKAEANAGPADPALEAGGVNLNALPILFFNRSPSYGAYEGGDFRAERRWETIGGEGGQPLANVSLHHVILTYQVYALAWDQLTLDLLTSLLDGKFRHQLTGFVHETRIMGYSWPSRAQLSSPGKLLAWSDMSPGIESDRLMCVSTSIEVIAERHQAWGIEAIEHGYGLYEPRPLFEEAAR